MNYARTRLAAAAVLVATVFTLCTGAGGGSGTVENVTERAGIVVLVRESVADRGFYRSMVCAGVLLEPNRVATAEHCLRLGIERLRVVSGVDDLCEGSAPAASALIEAVVWIDESSDVALLALSGSLGQANALRASPGDVPMGSEVLSWGWGGSFPDGPRRCEIRAVRQEVVSPDECAELLAERSQSLCVRPAPGETASTCTGDSGGPSFVVAGGTERLVGVTSGGVGCGAHSVGSIGLLPAGATPAWPARR